MAFWLFGFFLWFLVFSFCWVFYLAFCLGLLRRRVNLLRGSVPEAYPVARGSPQLVPVLDIGLALVLEHLLRGARNLLHLCVHLGGLGSDSLLGGRGRCGRSRGLLCSTVGVPLGALAHLPLLLSLVGGAGGGGLLGNLGAAALLLVLAQLRELGLGHLGGLGGGGADLREVLTEGSEGGHHGLLSDIPALRADDALVLEELGHGHGGRPRDLLLALGQGGVHLRDAGLEDAPHVLRGLQPPVGLLLGGVRVLGLLGALGGLGRGGGGGEALHLGLQGRQLGLHGGHLALQGSNLCGLRGHFGV